MAKEMTIRPRPHGVSGRELKFPLLVNYDAFSRMLDLLTFKFSSFLKDQSVSERDLMFGNNTRSLTTEHSRVVVQWLLTVSSWRANIGALERQLQKLSNLAMSKPSLKTFRPIPTLRQSITDMRGALQREKDEIGSEAIAAFSALQKTTNHQLESLDSVYETLLRETDALSAKASNEIQLVIGSVTIQVPNLHPCHTQS
jgi:hypothetical protein